MNILLTGAFKYSDSQIKEISDFGIDVTFLQYEDSQFEFDSRKIEAVVCNGLFLHHNLAEFPSLKYIQLTSAGLDRVPINSIAERGIILHNARGVYSVPIAEWVICKLLDCYKRSAYFIDRQRGHDWTKNREILELSGKKAAVLGAGSVGMEISKRLECFGVGVIGYDVFTNTRPHFSEIRNISEFGTDIEDYDIVIITLPLTEETYHMFGLTLLEKLRNSSVIINVARGSIINEKDMIAFLERRCDVTAILDVFEEEPLSTSSEIWSLPNVIVTPHNSFISEGNNERMFGVIKTNLQNYLSQRQ